MTIYLDNNATTPLVPEVWEAMRPFLEGPPGNPASGGSPQGAHAPDPPADAGDFE